LRHSKKQRATEFDLQTFNTTKKRARPEAKETLHFAVAIFLVVLVFMSRSPWLETHLSNTARNRRQSK
jgi:hypothetical protein